MKLDTCGFTGKPENIRLLRVFQRALRHLAADDLADDGKRVGWMR